MALSSPGVHQVISLLQKERTSMAKLHREYQKDRMDQLKHVGQ